MKILPNIGKNKEKPTSFDICRWVQIFVIFWAVVTYLLVKVCSDMKMEFVSVTKECGLESIEFSVSLDNAAVMRNASVDNISQVDLYDTNITHVDDDDHDGSIHEDAVSYVDGDLVYSYGSYWRHNGSTLGCPCLLKTCIRKCCPRSQMFLSREDPTCVAAPSPQDPFIPKKTVYYGLLSSDQWSHLRSKETNSFFIFYGENFLKGNTSFSYRSDLDKGHLLEDGILLTNEYDYLDMTSFCMEYSTDSPDTHIASWVEHQEDVPKWFLYLNYLAVALSLFSLGATLFVYATSPPLQNLQGKMFMQYLTSYILYFITFIFLEHDEVLSVLFYVNLTWMTVICFDIWWTFSTPLKPTSDHQRRSDLRKLVMYSVAGWIIPALLFALLDASRTFIPCASDDCTLLKARFQLFLSDLFYESMMLLNVLLFLFTMYNMRMHFKQTKAAASSKSDENTHSAMEGYHLYVKLSIVMGFQWSFMFWVAPKICNEKALVFFYLKSVAVFVVFVCNKRTLAMLRQKWSVNRRPSDSSIKTSLSKQKTST